MISEVFAKDNLAHIAVSFSFLKRRMEVRYGCIKETSDFVTSSSCIPDTFKFPKTPNNSWHTSRRMQRRINRFEDFLVEYPVRVISVAVVYRCIFLLVFFVLYIYRRTIFNFSKL